MRQLAGYATLIFVCLSVTAFSNHVDEYISTYKDIAQREMKRSNIPASIILAQGIHEYSWGRGELAVQSKNHFGIKCKDYWTGPTYYIEDDDYVNGKLIKSCFRAYDNVEDSYIDHTDFLVDNNRYQGLFLYDNTDYKNWAKGLKQCGYATDPNYASKLIRIIETHQLYLFDLIQTTPIFVMEAPQFHIPKHLLNQEAPGTQAFVMTTPVNVSTEYRYEEESSSIAGVSTFDYEVPVEQELPEEEQFEYNTEIALYEETPVEQTIVYEASGYSQTRQNNGGLIPNKTSGDKKIYNLSRKPRMSSTSGPR